MAFNLRTDFDPSYGSYNVIWTHSIRYINSTSGLTGKNVSYADYFFNFLEFLI
jgi:hypothetical protein